MLTNHVYKLRPNVTQASKMAKWVDMLRSHYNWCLADRITQYNQQFIVGDYCDIRTKGEACPLTCFVSKSGATGNPWKDSQFNKEGKTRNPRRSAGDIQITAFTLAMGVKLQGSKIYLPKVGWMRFHNSRPIPNGFTVKACTVRQRQNGWYISLRIEDKSIPDYIPKPLNEVTKVIGCDLGITKLVHLSDGYQINNPKFSTTLKAKRTLRIRQRRVNRKVKGSKNRKKAAKIVGRFHQKNRDQRQACQWKAANKIVSRNIDAIALEDLNVSGMMRRCKVKSDQGRFLKNGQSRKNGLNRSISDAGWGELILKIDYLAAKQGKITIKINPKHSSQECRKCRHIDKSNRHGEKFICVECGYHEHADIGAAKTIRDRALLMVRGDSAKPGVTHLNAQKISSRSTSKRDEFGNLSNQDIRAAKS